MKKLSLFASLPAAVLLAGVTFATTAFADDPILTKAPVASAPAAAPGPCDSVPAFFLSSCQLAWYGVKVYGVSTSAVVTRPMARRLIRNSRRGVRTSSRR